MRARNMRVRITCTYVNIAYMRLCVYAGMHALGYGRIRMWMMITHARGRHAGALSITWSIEM